MASNTRCHQYHLDRNADCGALFNRHIPTAVCELLMRLDVGPYGILLLLMAIGLFVLFPQIVLFLTDAMIT